MKVNSLEITKQDINTMNRGVVPQALVDRLQGILVYQHATKLYFTLESIDFEEAEND